MTDQANFLQSLGWAVLNSLWQLALLWVIYQLLTALFRSARPAAKSLLASSLLIIGFAWFVYTFFSVFSSGTGAGSATFSGIDDEAAANWLQNALPIASVCYLVLFFIPLFRFIRNYRYVQVIRNYGLSKMDAEWRLFVSTVAARMGIKKTVQIWVSEWVTSPVTIGYLKPVILVPLAALNQLSTQQMEAVLLHELSHIRRYDYLLNLVLNFIRTILYFNPFAKAFVKIVETEREKSCDEMVMQFQYDSHEYASALLMLEKVSREQRLLLLRATGNGKELLQRIETIMGVQQKGQGSLQRFTSVMAVLICVIGMNAILLLSKSIGVKGYAYRGQVATRSMNAVSDNYNRSITNELPVKSLLNKSGNAVETGGTGNPAATGNTGTAVAFAANPDFINANFETIPEVILDKEAEEMVKEAVQSSRKVLEGAQWKAMEKNLAEVFSEKEKEEIKSALTDEFSKFDWGEWENKLRQSYDKVNWEKVNTQLAEAVSLMRTDSLVKVYSDAMVGLNQAQKEMQDLSLEGIPDTDISLKAITEKKRQLQREVNRLKNIRNKKIVHL